MRLPKLLLNAQLVAREKRPGTPGILVLVQLHHDRDRGWWEVTARETIGDRRKTQGRYRGEAEADAALSRAYKLFDAEGAWEIRDYRGRS